MMKIVNLDRYKTNYKLGRPLLSPSGEIGMYDEKSVDCPFVFYHNDRYYMMHVGFDGIGYQTGLAVSDDLIHWEKEAVIFKRGVGTGWDQGGIAGMWILKNDHLFDKPTLKKVDGKYWMIYHSYPDAGYEAGSAEVGLAYTEDESLHTWTRLEEPVLSWRDGAAWEHAGLYKGCLVEDDGKFYLFYNAKDSEDWKWHEQIGAAVSDNMLEWKRVSDQPVIKNTPDGWDSCFCADPCVVRDGDKWVMYYYGYDGVHAQDGIAFSDDLLHWDKQETPILTFGTTGDLDAMHAHKPSVIFAQGRLYHFYCAVRESQVGDVAVNEDPTAENGDGMGEFRCITASKNATT